jgi:hypothetical protein
MQLSAIAANSMLAVPARLELATFGLGNRCSIRLSYGTGSILFMPRAGFLKERAF